MAKSRSSSDVVVSTRIRFARNIKGNPFPGRMTGEQKINLRQEIFDRFKEYSIGFKQEFSYLRLEELSDIEAFSLVERHLMSPVHAEARKGKGLILSDDNSISIMINEEDHLRIQVIFKGQEILSAYEIADKIDTLLDQCLTFSFDGQFGYLTQCPTNLGTGMRASVMLHIPALEEQNDINRLANNLSKMGLALRGFFGEGTSSVGGFYQLSNQVSLGLSEEEALDNVIKITEEIIIIERRGRAELIKNVSILDNIHRSLGILKSARLMRISECNSLFSLARLGAATGILSLDSDIVDNLLFCVYPATLMVNNKSAENDLQRHSLRAEIIRNTLEGVI